MEASGNGACVDLPIIYHVIHVRAGQRSGSVPPLLMCSYLFSPRPGDAGTMMIFDGIPAT